MAPSPKHRPTRALIASSALVLALAACDGDYDLRGNISGNNFDTTSAARTATEPRPQPDNRGVISYPNYQVAVAKRDDTVGDVAARVGTDAAALARYNGIAPDVQLREGEVLLLPGRVAEPSPATGAIATGPIRPAGQIDVTTLAGDAIDRAEASPSATSSTAAATPQSTSARPQSGAEPVRHKVARGETAYSVARLYNVSVTALADWNGLGSDLAVREGQYLLIPVAAAKPPASALSAAATTAPGQGSPTPEPPSAATPLPDEVATTAKPEATPNSPELASGETAPTRSAALAFPTSGSIIRPYAKGKNEGIDIGAPSGSAVKAANDGVVAAITQDTNNVNIVVLKHADNLLTVYAGVDAVSVKKGDKVSRSQQIAKVRSGDPSFLHFEVRQGLESVDPMNYLQ
ncbi:peptidoglycan DD-metalloendopeptidase family protein [Pseudoruegeria sp. SHC-113]|uniref:peptidoglycan DD-metalloendopeptidase family protein n=1 Tax=Pseudoruegeria sp. SHC-113 TaxID=2855439 RepID=UPI0021BB224B|nr:peptidoglycan DD-metalloendopeptidase family protein [Pseudoruegeria sp. SHC-113]MCT8159762.1 peptidoglycan DD-metalloendopeptidase family protein [Pseudoruegeria sp. SHC-113]